MNQATVVGIVDPLVAQRGLELVDVEHTGGILRVTVDRDAGVDLDSLGELTRELSRALDEHDPISGRYTLEVSSPGLERRLRTPAHFRRSVGAVVRVKTKPGYELPRRIEGELATATDDHIEVRARSVDGVAVAEREPAGITVPYAALERARTVFDWGPSAQSKPGRSKRSPKQPPAQPHSSEHKRKAAS